MTPALFPELDDDRAAEDAARRATFAPDEPESPDEGLDQGPDRMLQARLPGAGFVRLVENPTPTLDLPRQSVTSIVCEWCGMDTDTWTLRPSTWRTSTLRVCPRCARRKR